MSGTQNFHSPSLYQHVQAVNYERKHPSVTNEDEAHEAVDKFYLIACEMEKASPRWPWPTESNDALFMEELRVTSIYPLLLLYLNVTERHEIGSSTTTRRVHAKVIVLLA